jgi:hypothetical protein
MVTSTSASFGTGFSVASEPSRAIRKTPGVDRAATGSVRLHPAGASPTPTANATPNGGHGHGGAPDRTLPYRSDSVSLQRHLPRPSNPSACVLVTHSSHFASTLAEVPRCKTSLASRPRARRSSPSAAR